MSLILSIESAVSGFSVAVHRDGVLLSAVHLRNERVASSFLTSAIEQVINFSEISLSQLNAVAVSAGPGSYTGLRVGVATAKGLCTALDIPLLPINTLDVMVSGVNIFRISDNQLLCPLIDARRMEVYCALYNFQTKQKITKVSAEVVDEHTFADRLQKHTLIFFGNGASKIEKLYAQPNAIFLPNTISPSADDMGMLGANKFNAGDFADLTTFEPDYLKPYFATKPKNQLSPQ